MNCQCTINECLSDLDVLPDVQQGGARKKRTNSFRVCLVVVCSEEANCKLPVFDDFIVRKLSFAQSVTILIISLAILQFISKPLKDLVLMLIIETVTIVWRVDMLFLLSSRLWFIVVNCC